MAYDEDFAHRIRAALADEDAITEQKMFGGLAFLLHGNMAVGISGTTGALMVRVGREAADAALDEPHTRPMDMGARPMKGWVLVEPEGVSTKAKLQGWVDRGAAFAKSLPAKG